MYRPIYVISGVVIFLFGFAALNLATHAQTPRPLTDYSTVMEWAEKGDIDLAIITGHQIMLNMKAGGVFYTEMPPSDPLIQQLLDKKTRIIVRSEEVGPPTTLSVLISWTPIAVFIWAIWFFIGRPVNRMTARMEALLQLQKGELQPAKDLI